MLGATYLSAFFVERNLRQSVVQMLPVQEVTMHGVVVDVRFDNTHLFLNLSDGQAVRFPLNWFPVLKLAT